MRTRQNRSSPAGMSANTGSSSAFSNSSRAISLSRRSALRSSFPASSTRACRTNSRKDREVAGRASFLTDSSMRLSLYPDAKHTGNSRKCHGNSIHPESGRILAGRGALFGAEHDARARVVEPFVDGGVDIGLQARLPGGDSGVERLFVGGDELLAVEGLIGLIKHVVGG